MSAINQYNELKKKTHELINERAFIGNMMDDRYREISVRIDDLLLESSKLRKAVENEIFREKTNEAIIERFNSLHTSVLKYALFNRLKEMKIL